MVIFSCRIEFQTVGADIHNTRCLTVTGGGSIGEVKPAQLAFRRTII